MVFKLQVNFNYPIELTDIKLPVISEAQFSVKLHPYTQVDGISPTILGEISSLLNGNSFWNITLTSIVVKNGKMILSFPTSSNQYHKYTKTYEITYQENNTNQKIKRKGVVSKTVKTFTEEKSGFMVVDIDGNLIPVQGFAPEILSGSTDGDKILFTITPGRNISLLPGYDAPALNITVSDNVYANTNANPTFGDIDNPGTTGISDNKKLFVNIVNGALGSDAYVEPSIPESHVWVDQFNIPLQVSDNYGNFDNSILHPTLRAEITPDSNMEGKIFVYMEKDGDTIQNTSSTLVVSSDFNIDSNISNDFDEEPEQSYFSVKSDRFFKFGETHLMDYTREVDGLTNGLVELDDYNNPVQAVLPVSNILVQNSLQEIVVDTISEVKVEYPADKPTDLNDLTSSAYFYIDITFKKKVSGERVNLTAKYSYDWTFQSDSGHTIHHGLILTYDGKEIPEEITVTTIVKENGENADLLNGETGKILRIKFPAGNSYGGTKNAYNTSGEGSTTEYGFTDPSNPLTISFSDRQQKDWYGELDGDYYNINLLDENGNTASGFSERNVAFPSVWGVDTGGTNPGIISAELKIEQGQQGWRKVLELTFGQDVLGENLSGFKFYQGKEPRTEIPLTHPTAGPDYSGKKVSFEIPESVIGLGKNPDLSVDFPSEPIKNWFGFQFEPVSKYETTNLLDEVFTVYNISFEVTNFNGTNYDGILSWTDNKNNYYWNDTTTYTIERANKYNAKDTDWDTISTVTNTDPITITGLDYNKNYYFRIKLKTYEDSEWVVSNKIIEYNVIGGQVEMTNKYAETITDKDLMITWNGLTNEIKSALLQDYPVYKVERATYNDITEIDNQTVLTSDYILLSDDVKEDYYVDKTAEFASVYRYKVSIKTSPQDSWKLHLDSTKPTNITVNYGTIFQSNPIIYGTIENMTHKPNDYDILTKAGPIEFTATIFGDNNNEVKLEWSYFSGWYYDYLHVFDYKENSYPEDIPNNSGKYKYNSGTKQGNITYLLTYGENNRIDMSSTLDTSSWNVVSNLGYNISQFSAGNENEFTHTTNLSISTIYNYQLRISNGLQTGFSFGGEYDLFGYSGKTDKNVIIQPGVTLEEITVPDLVFGSQSQSDQLPITLDIGNGENYSNWEGITIYWSYKTSDGDWGGNFNSDVASDLASLYQTDVEIPSLVDQEIGSGGWLKLPVFWEGSEQNPNPNPDEFEDYDSTGGHPWYNLNGNTFNNLDYSPISDISPPLELKFIVFNTLAAGAPFSQLAQVTTSTGETEEEITVPDLVFGSQSQTTELPITLDIGNGENYSNWEGITIYWSYKTSDGDWGGNFESDVASDLASLYQTDVEIPSSVDQEIGTGGWLKLPVFLGR